MCGIVGIVYKDKLRTVDATLLTEMRDLLWHRGPDDSGIYIKDHVGLGHRRLAIIDIASGQQPMANEDGTLWIVFNGEVYNFKSLRESLKSRGHTFKTHSDTEVILRLYEDKREKCVSDLNGIFAFAIWDCKNQTLFLARDHMGVKPLYYAVTDDAFLFASEIKAIVKSGLIEPRCDDEGVFEYFMFRGLSGGKTLFRGVRSLLPAHTLRLEAGNIEMGPYWSAFPEAGEFSASAESAAEELSELIEDAVRLQLVSDVPLGTFCSGGVDSSLVTAIAAQLTEQPINTFSVGFHERAFDETRYAQVVSKQYGTVHHQLKLGSQEFAELLPKLIWHNDEPLNFANSVQIYAVSRLAKEYVTVVLTGEGSDELFAGYPRYLIPSLSKYYRRLPSFVRNVAGRYVRSFGSHRLEKLHRFACHLPRDALLFNSSFVEREFVTDLLQRDFKGDFDSREESLKEGIERGLSPVTNLSLLDQANYLVSILQRQDKMSMAASIESRVPFLDYRIVEFANRLPVAYKLKRLQTKVILKRVARKYLAKDIVYRRKSGFGVPLGKWLNDSRGLGRYVDDLRDDIEFHRYVDKEKLESIIKEHRAGRVDYSEVLWTAINVMLWTRTVWA